MVKIEKRRVNSNLDKIKEIYRKKAGCSDCARKGALLDAIYLVLQGSLNGEALARTDECSW
jgi:hypothetical protein